MADDFDPYYKWLAIPPAEQPPNHYRLLGVPLYTDDPDVIENAADQRMAHLRSFQSGRFSQASQRLLNEVSTARICLLKAGKKQDYDAALRLKLQPVAPAPAPQAPAVPVVAPVAVADFQPTPQVFRQPTLQPGLRPLPLPPPVPPPVTETPMQTALPKLEAAGGPVVHGRPSKRKPKSLLVEGLKHVAASATGLLCGYLVVGFFSPAWDHYGLFHRKSVASNPVQPGPKPDPKEPPDSQPPINNPPSLPVQRIQPAPSNPPAGDPPAVDPAVKPPTVKPMEKPLPPVPTAEELALQAEKEKRERLSQLQADRAAAVAAGEVVQALKLTAEFAQLSELDPRAEKARVIEELRKVDHSPAETFILTGAILEQARHALQNNHKELAAEQATAALQLARKTADQDLVRQATKLILEIQQP